MYGSCFKTLAVIPFQIFKTSPQMTSFEERVELKQNWTEVLLLTSLTPYRLTNSSHHHSYQCAPHFCGWLPVFGIFNMHTDADACDCTPGLHEHQKESALKVAELGSQICISIKSVCFFSPTLYQVSNICWCSMLKTKQTQMYCCEDQKWKRRGEKRVGGWGNNIAAHLSM